MSAAELLRSLSRDPITTFDADVVDRLLPLLAALVEAVEFANRESRVDPRVPLLPFGITRALDTLNAAAAKEAE